jgi:hypothetical protein
MLGTLRLLGVGLVLLLVAARVEAATVTLGWNPNAESDIARYYVGYRTSPTGAETLSPAVPPSACSGNPATCMWSLTTAVEGQTYYFRVYAENTSGLRSAPSAQVSATIPTTPPPPAGGGLTLERGALNFGAVQSSGSTLGTKTPGQRVMISQTAAGAPLAWTVASVGTGSSRISVSPTSGNGTTPITVTLASSSLAAGTYTNTVRVTVGSTQLNMPITTRVYAPGASTGPSGVFDTPTNGIVNVAGSLPVTGWAVDDVNVARVDIFRDAVGSEPAGAQILLGTASLVAGSRPDVENLYPNAPLNYRTGWGFMVLTNMLPDLVNGRATGGNGAFRLHAYAVDAEGRATYLGAKNFSANNTASTRPFGTLDTPAQGGTASGTAYMVWGWAISPRATIPTNGSTMTVFVDGTARGNPTYNNYRSDIAGMFPGYANSNGAIGYFVLNTTTLANGTHTISWVVTDNLGNTEGIGSRFFTVQNGSSSMTSSGATDGSAVAVAAQGEALGQTVETVSEVPTDNSMVEVTKVQSDDATPELVFPEWTGEIRVRTRETEQVEVRLASRFDDTQATYDGYVVLNGRMRPLPVGASLNPNTGVFAWQPGPGFIGRYRFVFLRTTPGGIKTRIPVDVRISPKHDGEERR